MIKRGHRVMWAGLAAVMLTACETDQQSIVGLLERDRLELVAERSEPIVEIFYREGDMVSAGKIVLQLSEARQVEVIKRLTADQQMLVARLDELEQGPRQQTIDRIAALLAGARAETLLRKRELDRRTALQTAQLDSDKSRDDAEIVLARAISNEQALTAQLAELKAGTRIEQLEQARAQLRSTEAALALAQIDQQRLAVRAPVDGWLDYLPFEAGEQPPANSTVAILLATDAIRLRACVPATLRSQLRPGQAATVRVDGIDGSFTGTLTRLSADASFTPYLALTESDRSRLCYMAEVELGGKKAEKLPAGMPATVEFLNSTP